MRNDQFLRRIKPHKSSSPTADLFFYFPPPPPPSILGGSFSSRRVTQAASVDADRLITQFEVLSGKGGGNDTKRREQSGGDWSVFCN